ncbi:ribonuclease HII [Aureimonas glaciei]|uniref:Ribonuclease HII n=1 Tax=Aureimonas glaciei TaxID=1776957 RepID=A0A916XTB0_9HYPH|nr:ribonuclease HII [Aureimonas glaciei]GGD07776.1 ribonuclease HII [Aureimonas glaciei]
MRESGRTMARHSSDSPSPFADGASVSIASVSVPDFGIEAARFERGALLVAGIDEAGRGPLAGPVVAAAVILDPARLPDGLNDSKKLTAADRERLFVEILALATVSVASASAAEIDRINIRQATLLAMRRAAHGLAQTPCHLLIDGNDVPPLLRDRATAVVQGDARSLSIAAASIIAKVTRDRMMTRLCQVHPHYGFGQHMGYATRQHLAAITLHGPCPHHRLSFSPMRQGELLLV